MKWLFAICFIFYKTLIPFEIAGGLNNLMQNDKPAIMQIRCKFGSLGETERQFHSPHGFCMGPNEEIIVADTFNHRIQVLLFFQQNLGQWAPTPAIDAPGSRDKIWTNYKVQGLRWFSKLQFLCLDCLRLSKASLFKEV